MPSKLSFLTRERKHLKKMKKILLFLIALVAIFASSCNVTRTVTNESQYYQKGDTSVVITTKTVETYDASKKN